MSAGSLRTTTLASPSVASLAKHYDYTWGLGGKNRLTLTNASEGSFTEARIALPAPGSDRCMPSDVTGGPSSFLPDEAAKSLVRAARDPSRRYYIPEGAYDYEGRAAAMLILMPEHLIPEVDKILSTGRLSNGEPLWGVTRAATPELLAAARECKQTLLERHGVQSERRKVWSPAPAAPAPAVPADLAPTSFGRRALSWLNGR